MAAHQEEGGPVKVHYQPEDPRRTAKVSSSHGSSIFGVIAVVRFGSSRCCWPSASFSL
ncbi:hypothetical protein [Streptomyces sp. 7N604]|uniref:hypothetical protein n=1 Tax=Streptomyces sp. 7N604 TaxID=3457415 RepID=UPI003FD5D2BD